jgi:glycosyltransferase involved in cell wall biosynthesis
LALSRLQSRPLMVSSDGTCRMTSKMLPFRYPGLGGSMGVTLSVAVERHVLAAASVVVAQSDWARDALVAEGISPERVHVVRAGAPSPRPLIIRPVRSPVRIAFVGSSMGRKGGWALIKALGESIGSTVELHLVTHERIRPRPGIVVHNDIWPNDGRIYKLLENVDIFALPTDMDMSPNAVLEAMACGLPIVSTVCGAIPEMVIHGQSGFLLRTDDQRGLRSSLYSLVSSPEQRSAFGARSLRILQDRFDRNRATEAFVQIVAGVHSNSSMT